MPSALLRENDRVGCDFTLADMPHFHPLLCVDPRGRDDRRVMLCVIAGRDLRQDLHRQPLRQSLLCRS
jgi:hypothetical protein